MLQAITHHGQAVEQAHHQPGEGLIVLGGGSLEAGTLAHQVKVQGAIGAKPLALLDNIRPFDFAGIGQFTGDGFENVGHAQHTHEVAEFVDHEGNVGRLLAHLLQGVKDREALQQIDRPARQVLKVRLVTGQVFLEQLLFMHKP